MAKVWFQANDESLGSRELNWGVTRVGRAKLNHLVIEHPSISAYHCELVLSIDTLIVRDCDSTNGTYVNGVKVSESPLEPGHTLRFGEIEGRVFFSRDPVTVPELPRRMPKQAIPFDDGTISCLNHADRRAARHCPCCDGVFCPECIHVLNFKGRTRHHFCPICSTATEAIQWGEAEEGQETFWQRFKGFFGTRQP